MLPSSVFQELLTHDRNVAAVVLRLLNSKVLKLILPKTTMMANSVGLEFLFF